MRKTCGSRRILPKSHYFRGRLFKTSNRPVSGGAADVWRVTDDRKQLFAAKVFRVNQGEEYKVKVSSSLVGYEIRSRDSLRLQRYYKELTIWKQLNHQNVVPTFGASTDIAEFCVVAPWMSEGELLQYLRKYPGADRMGIVRRSLQSLAGERTEFYVQDVWSGRRPFLPPPQRGRSRGYERGQSCLLGRSHSLTYRPSGKHPV